jgi:nitroreductase
MPLFEAAKRRRTIRADFLPKEVLREDIERILDAARWAPSGHNIQPWEFIVITDRDVKNEIANSTLEVLEEILKSRTKLEKTFLSYSKWFRLDRGEVEDKGDGIYVKSTSPFVERVMTPRIKETLRDHTVFREAGRDYCDRIRAASLIVVTIYDRKKEPPNVSSGLISMVGIGAALQNIRLAATALEIGCQDLARPIDTEAGRRRIKKLLKIPDDYSLVSIMRMGYVDKQATHAYVTNFRRPLTKLVHYNKF